MDAPPVVSRFAPSTTGEAHPGTLLSALLVWLDARAAELARACESQFLVAWARAAEGIVEFFAGRYAYAISCLSEAEVALRERSVGTAAEINHVRVFIVMALRRHNDYRELAVRQRDYLRDAIRRGDRCAAASFQWSSNVVWLAADDPARALLRGAASDAEAVDMPGTAALARRRLAELDGDAAALAEADAALAARGVTDPVAFARMFATWPRTR